MDHIQKENKKLGYGLLEKKFQVMDNEGGND